jgi:hypothetical protein
VNRAGEDGAATQAEVAAANAAGGDDGERSRMRRYATTANAVGGDDGERSRRRSDSGGGGAPTGRQRRRRHTSLTTPSVDTSLEATGAPRVRRRPDV